MIGLILTEMKPHQSYSGFTHFLKQIKRIRSKHLDRSGIFFLFLIFSLLVTYMYAMYECLRRTQETTRICRWNWSNSGYAGPHIPPSAFVIFFFKIKNRYFSHTLHTDCSFPSFQASQQLPPPPPVCTHFNSPTSLFRRDQASKKQQLSTTIKQDRQDNEKAHFQHHDTSFLTCS